MEEVKGEGKGGRGVGGRYSKEKERGKWVAEG